MKSYLSFLCGLSLFASAIPIESGKAADALLKTGDMHREEKLISSLHTSTLNKKTFYTFGYCKYPLQGKIFKRGFDSLQVIMREVLFEFGKIVPVTGDQISSLLTENKDSIDILILPVSVEYEKIEQKSLIPEDVIILVPTPMGFMFLKGGILYAKLLEKIEFVAIDCRQKSKIWSKCITKDGQWFLPSRPRTTDFTYLGRLCDQMYFTQSTKMMVFNIREELKPLLIEDENKKRKPREKKPHRQQTEFNHRRSRK